jgi:hypothetical protein
MRAAFELPRATILDDLHSWLDEQLRGLRPKSPVSCAIKYSLRNWDALCRFTSNGNIAIDNNRTERTRRAQAVGTKNWLFLGSDNSGRTPAVLYRPPRPLGNDSSPARRAVPPHRVDESRQAPADPPRAASAEGEVAGPSNPR